MKLYYTKILLFSLPLNILVLSTYAHNKKKQYITQRHAPTTISRVLSECDKYTSIYNDDTEMKSVKENFDRQTSQRFDEYEEHMKVKRQKRKEERDKNIQEIIEKDKMEKSLAEKIEKGCVRCGCALGGVAASVGLFGELGIYGWNAAATATAMAEGAAAAKAAGEAAYIAEGIKAVISGLDELGVSTLNGQKLVSYITQNTYNNASLIFNAIRDEYQPSLCFFSTGSSVPRQPFCSLAIKKFVAAQKIPEMTRVRAFSMNDVIETAVETIVSNAQTPAAAAAKKATDEAIQRSIAVVDAKYAICQTAIIASVVALLIIVLVMIIIYLVLSYRRKKKMNKKAQYTKLLNE
ncbi:rifin [Plasmodium sp. gorilla clade G1]|nr:rifin [Plasmodium sp. gorilla clade G1]